MIPTINKNTLLIGIDPDVEASGFAAWDKRQFVEVCKLDLADIFTALSAYHEQYDIKIRLEAGWLSKGLNWHRGGTGSANDVGRNHEIGRQIEKYCKKYELPYELVKPLGYSGWSHQQFCLYTNWPKAKRTNSETRVAALLVYGY